MTLIAFVITEWDRLCKISSKITDGKFFFLPMISLKWTLYNYLLYAYTNTIGLTSSILNCNLINRCKQQAWNYSADRRPMFAMLLWELDVEVPVATGSMEEWDNLYINGAAPYPLFIWPLTYARHPHTNYGPWITGADLGHTRQLANSHGTRYNSHGTCYWLHSRSMLFHKVFASYTEQYGVDQIYLYNSLKNMAIIIIYDQCWNSCTCLNFFIKINMVVGTIPIMNFVVPFN